MDYSLFKTIISAFLEIITLFPLKAILTVIIEILYHGIRIKCISFRNIQDSSKLRVNSFHNKPVKS
jgi:hypothetical protein